MSCEGQKVYTVYLDGKLINTYSNFSKVKQLELEGVKMPHRNTFDNNKPKDITSDCTFQVNVKYIDSKKKGVLRIDVAIVQ